MDRHRRLEGDANADAQFARDVSLRGPPAPDLFADASAASEPASRRDLDLPKAQSTGANLANGKGTKGSQALKQAGCIPLLREVEGRGGIRPAQKPFSQASLVDSVGERTCD